jgi:phosphoserine phosphatase
MSADLVPRARSVTPDCSLASWRDGAARRAVLHFVERAAAEVPPDERVAVFDDDGTLWCEMPMPIQLDFIRHRLVEMASADPGLADQQPWKAACERDYAWLSRILTDRYAGDRLVTIMTAGLTAAYDGMDVEDFEVRAETFLRTARHPVLDRPYPQCTYRPMVELLGLLAAHGFATYIASGSGRDFLRPVSAELFGVPRDRVIGGTVALSYRSGPAGGTITHTPVLESLADGAQKPVRIWSRVGRRPLLAAGNSNGDGPMLEFARRPGLPCLRLLVHHDDPEREFGYTAGAEQVLARAARSGWTVVSMREDWATVF